MAYAERKFKLSKQDAAKKFSKWAQKPGTVDETAKVSERQRDLWDALNQYVTERGALIVSVKHANPLTLEVPLESPLVDKLREQGLDLIFCERRNRLGGVAVPEYDTRWRKGVVSGGYGFTTVDVYQIRLPK
jgi:hypothetical protein